MSGSRNMAYLKQDDFITLSVNYGTDDSNAYNILYIRIGVATLIFMITETTTRDKPAANTACNVFKMHYIDVIMSAIASQITGVSIICSTVFSDVDRRKHQSFAWQAFAREIHRWPVDSPHKGPVTRKMFPFDDVFTVRIWFISSKWALRCIVWNDLLEVEFSFAGVYTAYKKFVSSLLPFRLLHWEYVQTVISRKPPHVKQPSKICFKDI